MLPRARTRHVVAACSPYEHVHGRGSNFRRTRLNPITLGCRSVECMRTSRSTFRSTCRIQHDCVHKCLLTKQRQR